MRNKIAIIRLRCHPHFPYTGLYLEQTPRRWKALLTSSFFLHFSRTFDLFLFISLCFKLLCFIYYKVLYRLEIMISTAEKLPFLPISVQKTIQSSRKLSHFFRILYPLKFSFKTLIACVKVKVFIVRDINVEP